MEIEITYKIADEGHYDEIISLLKDNDLPFSDSDLKI